MKKWLLDNHAALNKVGKGLKDSAAKRLVDKGSFFTNTLTKTNNSNILLISPI